MANIDGSLASQQLDAGDSGVSWLPLYHDMGLIGFVLAPMCAQRSVDLLPPRDFARRPLQWLSLISRRRATITYSPSFGYDLVRAPRRGADCRATSTCRAWRVAGVGADMIQPRRCAASPSIFAPAGFDDRAFLPSYGMAEVCVGLSFGRRFGGYVDATRRATGGGRASSSICGRVDARPCASRSATTTARALGERAGRPALRARPERDGGLLRQAGGQRAGAGRRLARHRRPRLLVRRRARASPAAPRT